MGKRIAVAYGGVSPEHEVSIMTALQVMAALKEAKYEVLPIYVSKLGNWFMGDERFLQPEAYRNLNKLKDRGKKIYFTTNRQPPVLHKSLIGIRPIDVDVFFPVFHGRNGEDGSVQAWAQMVNLPLVGCGLIASAVGMDKFLAKQIAAGIGLGVCRDVLVGKKNFEEKKREIKKLKLPVFVKPISLGSTIGISKVEKWQDLQDALKVAWSYDERALVEEGVKDPTEVNISVLGNGPYKVSVTEQPLSKGKILSFEDKYISGGKGKTKKRQGMASAQRYMPAKVAKSMIKKVEQAAVDYFEAIGGKGISRIDFMVDKKNKLIFNEINTMPGSLAFYLWEKSGIKFSKLVDKLVKLAIEDWQQRQRLVTTFDSNILETFWRNLGSKT